MKRQTAIIANSDGTFGIKYREHGWFCWGDWLSVSSPGGGYRDRGTYRSFKTVEEAREVSNNLIAGSFVQEGWHVYPTVESQVMG
jgi:hypothetical protein